MVCCADNGSGHTTVQSDNSRYSAQPVRFTSMLVARTQERHPVLPLLLGRRARALEGSWPGIQPPDPAPGTRQGSTAQTAEPRAVRTFEISDAGPLQVQFDAELSVREIGEQGLGYEHGIRLGMRLVAFQGVPAAELSLDVVMGLQRTTPRPWALQLWAAETTEALGSSDPAAATTPSAPADAARTGSAGSSVRLELHQLAIDAGVEEADVAMALAAVYPGRAAFSAALLSHYRKAVEADPSRLDCHLALAEIYLCAGAMESVLPQLQVCAPLVWSSSQPNVAWERIFRLRQEADEGAKIMNFLSKTRNFVSKSHTNEELCIKITQKREILYLK